MHAVNFGHNLKLNFECKSITMVLFVSLFDFYFIILYTLIH